jgi:hypothetical protein
MYVILPQQNLLPDACHHPNHLPRRPHLLCALQVAEHYLPTPPNAVIPRSNSPNLFSLDRTVSWHNHGTKESRDRSEPLESAVVTIASGDPSEVQVYPPESRQSAPLDKKEGHDPLNRQPAPNDSPGVSKTRSFRRTQDTAPGEPHQGRDPQNALRNTSTQISRSSSSNAPVRMTAPTAVSQQRNEATDTASPEQQKQSSASNGAKDTGETRTPRVGNPPQNQQQGQLSASDDGATDTSCGFCRCFCRFCRWFCGFCRRWCCFCC